VDSTPLEHSSILKFIEYNWGLAPLTRRDAAANNILDAFSFDQAPRPAVFLPLERVTQGATQRREPVRSWIFVFYGGTLMVAVVLFVVLMWVMLADKAGKARKLPAPESVPTLKRIRL
jgi:phospholipase C